jgi:uncharacterized lipoprotein YmbA
LVRLAACGLAVALAACSKATPPPNLYLLTAEQAPAAGERSTVDLPKILVAQAQVPDYLDRPQLVEHNGENGLKLLDGDQWAERLSMNVARVVAQNLSAMVPADATIPIAARGSLQYKCQVVISLNSFELNSTAGEALLIGRWSITDAEGANEFGSSTVSLRKPSTGPGMAGAVQAMSQALGDVSRDIATQFKKLKSQCGT